MQSWCLINNYAIPDIYEKSNCEECSRENFPSMLGQNERFPKNIEAATESISPKTAVYIINN